VTMVGLPGIGKSTLANLQRESALVLDAREGLGPDALDAARASSRAVLACAYTPLAVEGEHVFRLGPLAIPSYTASDDEILAAPAVVAFLAAARRAGAAVIDPLRDAVSLSRAVRRTSGLPLAIELSARHLTALSLDALSRVLARPGQLAALPGAVQSRRHASIRAALAPILERLSTPAHELLLRMAPHAIGLEVDLASSLGALRELVDAGLAERVIEAPPQQTWARAHAIVGALALELVEPAKATVARRDHVTEIGARIARAARDARERNDPGAARQLAALGEDVSLALEHAEADLDRAQAATASHAALEHARATSAPTRELVSRLEALASRAGDPADVGVSLSIERATLADREGRADDALRHLERAVALSATADARVRADVAMARGLHFREVRRDYTAAREAFEEAARSPDPLQRARALSGAGGTLTWAERFGEAERVFERARDVVAGTDAPRMSAVIATNLAIARVGHWPSPRASRPRTLDVIAARNAAVRFEGIDDEHAACVARQAAALGLTTLLRFEEAETELVAMLDLARSVDSRRFVAVAELDLGEMAFAMNELERADAHLARGLEIATALEDRLLSGVAHAFLGDLAWERGELGRARDALQRARTMLERDAEHASRLALVLAEEAVLAGERGAHLAARAESLAGDESNVHRHAVRVYAALTDHRAGRRDPADARVLPWLAAQVSLLRSPPSRRGADGLGVPFAVWLALRRYVRELDATSRRAMLERAHDLDAHAGPTLLVDADRRCVRAPSGKWIDLSRRERPFALLVALATTGRSRTCAVNDLVERVWPGEKMLASAGANRVYAATALLRKQPGLRDVVQSDASGYRIAPEVDVLVFRERYAPTSELEAGA